MQTMENEILEYQRKNLPRDRYEHVLGVTDLAGKLAEKHGLDAARARLAGALHDTARCWSKARLLRYVRRYSVKVPELGFVVRHQPVLLHGYVGAHLARRQFGIKDREILSAVAKHSLGSDKMTRFEKCVYLADLLSPERNFYGADALRELMLKNLDQAFLQGIAVKIRYVVGRGEPLHPEVVRIWNRLTSGRAAS